MPGTRRPGRGQDFAVIRGSVPGRGHFGRQSRRSAPPARPGVCAATSHLQLKEDRSPRYAPGRATPPAARPMIQIGGSARGSGAGLITERDDETWRPASGSLTICYCSGLSSPAVDESRSANSVRPRLRAPRGSWARERGQPGSPFRRPPPPRVCAAATNYTLESRAPRAWRSVPGGS